MGDTKSSNCIVSSGLDLSSFIGVGSESGNSMLSLLGCGSVSRVWECCRGWGWRGVAASSAADSTHS